VTERKKLCSGYANAEFCKQARQVSSLGRRRQSLASGNASTLSNFVVLEEAGERVARPVIAWWMVEELGCDIERLEGPLPDNMVVEMSSLGLTSLSASQVPPSLKSLLCLDK
jgi:hypothetical protein